MFDVMKVGESRRYRDVTVIRTADQTWSVECNGRPMPDGNGSVLTNVKADMVISWMLNYIR